MQTLLLFLILAFAICDGTRTACKNNRLGADVIAQSTRGFANNFLKAVVKDNEGKNVICSALSAQIALAMAAYGAGGTTAAQMRSILGIPSDDKLGLTGYRSFIRTSNNVTSVELDIADKIFTASQFKVKAAYQQLTTTYFLSSTQSLDILNNPTESASIINAWCAQQTNNRITDIVTPESLTPDTMLLLMNAVYFKGQWDQKFDAALTQDKPFHVDNRTTKNVPTMFSERQISFARIPTLEATVLELPYKGNDTSFVVILPDQVDGLKTVINNIDQVNPMEILQQASKSKIQLYLPKFELETKLDLNPTLVKMGLTEMYRNSANFSGISDVPLKIGQVIQKAFIKSDEEGSEAAAVTVVGVVALAVIATPPKVISIDRPFMYAIYHKPTKVGLFFGVVHDPSSK